MRYDLNLMPVFIAVMEERSITRAAQRPWRWGVAGDPWVSR